MPMQYILIPGIAWFVAQSSKHLARLFGRNRRVTQSNPRSPVLFSGGMPSAHSATVVSLALTIGYYQGWESPLFSLAAWFAAIVLYDAVMVRFSSGQQGDLLNRVVQKDYPKLSTIRVAHGHTLPEMLVGAAVGTVVTFVVIFATR